jgi:hypothetical protein
MLFQFLASYIFLVATVSCTLIRRQAPPCLHIKMSFNTPSGPINYNIPITECIDVETFHEKKDPIKALSLNRKSTSLKYITRANKLYYSAS